MIFPFGPWEPDKPDFGKASRTAKNVMPIPGGYGPFPGATVISDALGGACLGATAFRDLDGNVQSFAGDATKLYRLINSLWSDVSGSTYGSVRWKFVQFGSNIIAANGSDRLQRFDLTNSTTFEEIGEAPRASHIAVVRDFVVAGDTGDDNFPVKWSANNNSEEWTAGTNSAGAQPFPEGGRIRGITGGEYGTILQDDALTRMSFVGGDVIFQFDRVETARGCLASGSIAKIGRLTFYLSQSGFELFDGLEGKSIGNGRVDTTFFNDVDASYLQNISAGVDARNKLVVWAYPSASSSGALDKILVYSWGENRWSEAEVDTQFIFGALSEGTGLDSISGSMDTLTPSLDSDYWKGGIARLGGFDTSNRLVFFTGANLAGQIETGEFQPTPERKTRMRTARALIDGPHTITVSHRDNLSEDLTVEAAATPRASGLTTARANARYFRLKASTSAGADWSHALGIDVEGTPGGR